MDQSASSGSGPETTAGACPRCGQKLADPGGLGWCSKCGYCRSLEEDKAKAPVEKQEAPKEATKGEAVNILALVTTIPRWVFVLVGGTILIVAGAVWTSKNISDARDRAIFSAFLIGLGAFLILAAQVAAMIRLAPHDEKVGIKDILLPMRLWGLIFQGLPRLQGAVWIAGWGLTMILSAIFLVGGLSYWERYLPGQKKGVPAKKPRSERRFPGENCPRALLAWAPGQPPEGGSFDRQPRPQASWAGFPPDDGHDLSAKRQRGCGQNSRVISR